MQDAWGSSLPPSPKATSSCCAKMRAKESAELDQLAVGAATAGPVVDGRAGESGQQTLIGSLFREFLALLCTLCTHACACARARTCTHTRARTHAFTHTWCSVRAAMQELSGLHNPLDGSGDLVPASAREALADAIASSSRNVLGRLGNHKRSGEDPAQTLPLLSWQHGNNPWIDLAD